MEYILLVVIIVSILSIITFVLQIDKTTNRDCHHSTSRIYHIDDNGRIIKGRPVDGRTLDGKPLSTDNDWTQWYVWKGYADDGIVSRLSELEIELVAPDTADPIYVLNEWHWNYNRYRRICMRHSMWNRLIGDHAPFIPTSTQLDLEKRLFVSLEHKMKDAQDRQRSYMEYSKLLFSYLLNQPRHIGDREKAIASISGGNAERKRELRKVYRYMIRNHVLIEKQNNNDRWVFRKPPAVKTKEYEFPSQQAIYLTALYQKVTERTEYKALITVDEPVDLDWELRHCKFRSKTRNVVYYTTTESCTCPVFCAGSEPCKHMVKLASALGLYNIKVNAKVEKETPFSKRTKIPAAELDECEDVKEDESFIAEDVTEEDSEDSMIASRTKLLYRELIQHFDEEGIDYVDKTVSGGSLYFFSDTEAESLKKKGYPVMFAEKGTKGTDHRPAWYIKI